MGAQDTGLNEEHVLLLALLKLNHGTPVKGRRRFHQLVFLAQHGGFDADPLDDTIEQGFTFERSDYGPRSDDLDGLLQELIDDGLVDSDGQGSEADEVSLTVTEAGSRALDRHRDKIETHEVRLLKMVKRLYNKMPLLELFDRFRAQYPEYVANSRL